MEEIKKIGIFSLGKFIAIISFTFSLVLGIILGFIISIGLKDIGLLENLTMTTWIIAAIIFPIAMGLLGFLIGIISALIYNIVAKLLGGIKMDTIQLEKSGIINTTNFQV